jgi:hypothetical protein
MRQVNEDLGNDGRKQQQQKGMLLDAESELAAWVQAALRIPQNVTIKGDVLLLGWDAVHAECE